jgi:hypothetical protein
MNTARPLHHVVIQTSRPVRSAAGEPSTGTAPAWAARGILILALISGSLGVVAAVSAGHVSAGHVSAHQQAGTLPLAAGASPASPSDFIGGPWMY